VTFKSFLNKLSQIKGWELLGDGIIRNKHQCCPLIAVANKVGPRLSLGSIGKAQRRLGLKRRDAINIVFAADAPSMRPRIRKQILKACKL